MSEPTQSLDLERLRARFCAALQANGGEPVFDELVQRYGEAQRHYHTLAHIDACLGWLDWFAGSAEQPAEVELALWFHDVHYDPARHDNEALSAQLMAARLAPLGIAGERIERIAEHVLATRTHRAGTSDGALVVDLDLSILAAEPADYARFEHDVRREYAAVPEPLFREGRARVLGSFLERAHVYTTPAVRELLEARARSNLTHALAALRATAP